MDMGFITNFMDNFKSFVFNVWLSFFVPIFHWWGSLPVWIYYSIYFVLFVLSAWMVYVLWVNREELSYW